MAKSITVGKRENEKKRLAKREEKQKKKDSKKLSSKSSFDDMIAYVDENGMITSTPPAENIKKEEINLDEIIIATPKKEDEEPVILRGRVEFFNEARGFGFIKDLAGVDKYFFHVNSAFPRVAQRKAGRQTVRRRRNNARYERCTETEDAHALQGTVPRLRPQGEYVGTPAGRY